MPWFKYEQCSGGEQIALVSTRLKLGEKTSPPLKFLVDSGASRSLVPRCLLSSILPSEDSPEQDIGIVDASGKALKGLPLSFDVTIIGGPGVRVIRERIWVCKNITWSILGLTWFEGVGVHFQNFPNAPYGRRFALYSSHWCEARMSPKPNAP